jgi:hypothetical protein
MSCSGPVPILGDCCDSTKDLAIVYVRASHYWFGFRKYNNSTYPTSQYTRIDFLPGFSHGPAADNCTRRWLNVHEIQDYSRQDGLAFHSEKNSVVDRFKGLVIITQNDYPIQNYSEPFDGNDTFQFIKISSDIGYHAIISNYVDTENEYSFDWVLDSVAGHFVGHYSKIWSDEYTQGRVTDDLHVLLNTMDMSVFPGTESVPGPSGQWPDLPNMNAANKAAFHHLGRFITVRYDNQFPPFGNNTGNLLLADTLASTPHANMGFNFLERPHSPAQDYFPPVLPLGSPPIYITGFRITGAFTLGPHNLGGLALPIPHEADWFLGIGFDCGLRVDGIVANPNFISFSVTDEDLQQVFAQRLRVRPYDPGWLPLTSSLAYTKFDHDFGADPYFTSPDCLQTNFDGAVTCTQNPSASVAAPPAITYYDFIDDMPSRIWLFNSDCASILYGNQP